MAKICTTEKTARRQEWIEQGLLTLMQRSRFETITVTDLCCYLSLSRRSFYRYFRDLEDVLDSALNHVFQRMALPEGLPDSEDLRKHYAFWQENGAVLDALHRSGMTDRLYDYIGRYTKSVPLGDAELQQDVSLFATVGSMALIINWHREGFRRTPEEMSRVASRMLYEPLLKRK